MAKCVEIALKNELFTTDGIAGGTPGKRTRYTNNRFD